MSSSNKTLIIDNNGNDSKVGINLSYKPTKTLEVGGDITSTGTVSAQNVTATGNLTGTLATGDQPNITSIASRLVFDTQTSGDNRVVINNSSALWIANSHALSTGVTHFNYIGETRVNYIRGTTEFSHTAYFPAGTPSDDRLKHNEQIITNGLSIISQLTPKKYDKTQEMLGPDYNGVLEVEYTKETGLIAQELLETDISFVVKTPEDLEKDPYGVDYNSVFTYAIAAIKELDAIVQSQASTINELETRLTLLENK